MAFFSKNETKKAEIKKVRIKIPNKTSDITTIISSNTTIDGDIAIDGHLDFAGKINGNIKCISIVVRDSAIVNGDITAADSVKISGKVKGTVKGKSVFLHDDCHMEGTVYQESLVIEDGAFLDGQCKRLSEEKATEEKPTLEIAEKSEE